MAEEFLKLLQRDPPPIWSWRARSKPIVTTSFFLSETRRRPRVPGRPTAMFHSNLAALTKTEAVVAVCDGPQVDDGTAWEIGYAYARNIQVHGLRTDSRIGQQADERINLMILESLSELSPTIERLLHTIRYAEHP